MTTNDWGTLISAILAFGSVIISLFALSAAKRAALASERQARAAEEQASAVPAQLAAAETAAKAAAKQAELASAAAEQAASSAQLSKAQMQAALRPVLIIERRTDRMQNMTDFLVNTGQGLATDVTGRYGTDIPPSELQLPNVLSAGAEKSVRVDWSRVQDETIYLNYKSHDGRKFITHIKVDRDRQPINDQVESSY